jgi:hypothetical protein
MSPALHRHPLRCRHLSSAAGRSPSASASRHLRNAGFGRAFAFDNVGSEVIASAARNRSEPVIRVGFSGLRFGHDRERSGSGRVTGTFSLSST